MPRNSQVIFAFGLIMALVSTIGCAGKIRYSSYYVLDRPAPAPRLSQEQPIAGSLAVRQFAAPSYLREGPIVYREPGNRLGFYEYNRWAVDPRRTVTDAVAQEMQSRHIFQSVDRYDGRVTPDYMLSGEIRHLEEVDDGSQVSIEVTLSARLTDLHTGNMLWQDTASQTASLDQRSVSGIVEEMSRDLEVVVGRLASSMESHFSRQLKAER